MSDGASGGSLSAVADAARHPRPVWRSERAYVLASAAGVVGLGNIWRFPYMAGLHGGGSFLVAYLVCVVLVALPLAALETTAGRLARRSPVGVYRRAGGRAGALVGWAVVALTVAIMSYYFVVTGWTLGYAIDAVRGSLVTFGEFTSGLASLWLFLAVGVAVYLVSLRGVGAVERVSLLLLPLLVVIVGGLAVYSLTLHGASEARPFLFDFDGARLRDAGTWQAAAGQSFYSLGVGQGVLVAYGSYVPAGTNTLRSTAWIAATNSTISIVAGLMIFSLVFAFGLEPDVGSELSFSVLPRVFPEIPAGEQLAIAFFVLLFLAGFTSCLSGAVVAMSAVQDETPLGRVRATALVVGGIVLLGVPSALSFTSVGFEVGGQPFLDRMDQVTGSSALVVLGLGGAALLALRLPRRRLAVVMNANVRHLGSLRLGPRLVLAWATVLPFIALAAYLASALLDV